MLEQLKLSAESVTVVSMPQHAENIQLSMFLCRPSFKSGSRAGHPVGYTGATWTCF